MDEESHGRRDYYDVFIYFFGVCNYLLKSGLATFFA